MSIVRPRFAVALGFCLGSIICALGAETVPFPGKPPGIARADLQVPSLSLDNDILSLHWSLKEGRLGQGRMEARLSVSSPVEELVLAEAFHIRVGSEDVPASALHIVGQPSVAQITPVAASARLADRIPGKSIRATLEDGKGRFRVEWRILLSNDAGYVREEIVVTPLVADIQVEEVVVPDTGCSEAQALGTVDGSPVGYGSFFFGCENPMAKTSLPARLSGASGSQSAACRLPWKATLRRGETLAVSAVLGVAPAGQRRRAFLHYLERERAHPFRPYLHYNSWYDTAWEPFALNETNCLQAIQLIGERLVRAHGVVLDGMVFDDGWDNPKSLWQFHAGFPRGFAPLAAACQSYGTRLGVWLSPFGGYGDPKDQRLKFGGGQGYETNSRGLLVGRPQILRGLQERLFGNDQELRGESLQVDGIATGMYASGGGQYILDTEAMRRLMLELRREDPDLYINLTTGSWPSPFWLRYADSLWRQGEDMGLAGKGPRQQQWLTYRDQEVYRNIVGKGPLFPLNSLMSQGVAYSRHGTAGDPTFTSPGFKDDVRAFFGSGTGLQELYIQPDKLTPNDWQVLAEAAKWSRANSDVFVDTHWIGGDPSKLEVYGYASWAARKGIVMLRNPGEQPASFSLDIAMAFELPAGAATRFLLKSPWAEDADTAEILATAGKPSSFALKPFEVLLLDAIPVP